MTKLADFSQSKGAKAIGYGFLLMFILVIIGELLIFQRLIVDGDAASTAKNVKANEVLFRIGIAVYFVIITVDATIALAVYVAFKSVSKNLALVSSVFRLTFDAIMVFALISISLLSFDEYFLGKVIAYIFSILTIFTLGCLVLKAGYMPKSLGALLIFASFCYFIIFFGHFFIPTELYEVLYLTAMLPATFAEMSIGIWLLLKADKIPEMNSY